MIELLSQKEIKNRIKVIGKQISNDFKNKDVVLVCVLKGAYMFFSDLVKHIKTKNKIEIDFIQVSSYGSGTKSSGNIKLIKDITLDVKNKNVILIEDIVDKGLTINFLTNYFLQEKKCLSISICSLLQKTSENDIEIDYLGFEIENHFVIGYGLDYAEEFRTLPNISYLIDKDLSK